MGKRAVDGAAKVTTRRLEVLVDGIFAIVMTLLVLSIEIPQLTDPLSNTMLLQSLGELLPRFQSYGLAFVLLAIFWKGTHWQFHCLKRTDAGILVINVWWLMLVALVPFSTSLVGKYGDLEIAAIFFHGNLLAAGLLKYWHWSYAARRGLIEDSVSPHEIMIVKRKVLVLPVVCTLALIVSIGTPNWSPMVYIAIPFVHRLFLRRNHSSGKT